MFIFDDAKGGTRLMQMNQAVGIDLPLKALVWQDAVGKVWLSYNDPGWLAQRHGLEPQPNASLEAMTTALNAMAKAATEAS